ncbi:hypothetical protein TorRG33x02_211960 [Trema orientale]|uniref:Uncharacterized protein n=1 Tax=Trema orientale TaxID=63057 RepID=A0A2P5EBV8_TREOI|nr:hypothetical protein TorRG33x02_211960 [Trema orientale]
MANPPFNYDLQFRYVRPNPNGSQKIEQPCKTFPGETTSALALNVDPTSPSHPNLTWVPIETHHHRHHHNHNHILHFHTITTTMIFVLTLRIISTRLQNPKECECEKEPNTNRPHSLRQWGIPTWPPQFEDHAAFSAGPT